VKNTIPNEVDEDVLSKLIKQIKVKSDEKTSNEPGKGRYMHRRNELAKVHSNLRSKAGSYLS
jgi:hypothetical protein